MTEPAQQPPPHVDGEADELPPEPEQQQPQPAAAAAAAGAQPSVALERSEHAQALALAPDAKPGDLVARLGLIEETMKQAMRKDVDYGVIPGTGGKPSLLKPGAEKLGVLFKLDVQIAVTRSYGPGDHLTAEAKAIAYDIETSLRVGDGEGECSTRESRYAYRQRSRTCPECGAETIKRSKHPDRETGDRGWYCWQKIDGCGANFHSEDPRIVEQETGRIENPDLPDLYNTVVKMARKRARIDAILNVTGASALFTQDVEDGAPPPEEAPPAAPEWAKPADERWMNATFRALTYLLGVLPADERLAIEPGDQTWALEVFKKIGALTDGALPLSSAQALTTLAAAKRKREEAVEPQAAAEQPEQPPADAGEEPQEPPPDASTDVPRTAAGDPIDW